MSYKRADEILPDDVLEMLQKYVCGETIYVPQKGECRKKWGANTGVRESLHLRNEKILADFRKGIPIKELAEKYYLTEKSIQRILRNIRTGPPMEEDIRREKIE